MESFKFKNRDGRDITFTYNGDGSSVVMSDFGSYFRSGSHTPDGAVSFVDPSGGPFIFVGMDFNDIIYPKLEDFLEQPESRIVTKITHNLMGVNIEYKKKEKKK